MHTGLVIVPKGPQGAKGPRGLKLIMQQNLLSLLFDVLHKWLSKYASHVIIFYLNIGTDCSMQLDSLMHYTLRLGTFLENLIHRNLLVITVKSIQLIEAEWRIYASVN